MKYEIVPVGKELTFTGTVMDKETGKPLKGEDGNDLTATAKYTPTEASGTAEVKFTLNGAAAGKTLVVFEDVKDADGKVIAEHKDINSPDQTVYVGKVGTNANDQADGDKTLTPGGTIVDVADYSNLPAGTATVEAQLVDKKTGEAVPGVKGEATVDLKEKEAGQFQVAIKLPQDIRDGDYVVFETVRDAKGEVIAEHRDLGSESRTVTVKAPVKPVPPTPGTPGTPGTPVKPGTPAAPQVHTGGDVQSQTALGAGLAGLALPGGGGFLFRNRRKARQSD